MSPQAAAGYVGSTVYDWYYGRGTPSAASSSQDKEDTSQKGLSRQQAASTAQSADPAQPKSGRPLGLRAISVSSALIKAIIVKLQQRTHARRSMTAYTLKASQGVVICLMLSSLPACCIGFTQATVL